jgi:hypothetical protein
MEIVLFTEFVLSTYVCLGLPEMVDVLVSANISHGMESIFEIRAPVGWVFVNMKVILVRGDFKLHKGSEPQ